jgi:hypothetical protein
MIFLEVEARTGIEQLQPPLEPTSLGGDYHLDFVEMCSCRRVNIFEIWTSADNGKRRGFPDAQTQNQRDLIGTEAKS